VAALKHDVAAKRATDQLRAAAKMYVDPAQNRAASRLPQTEQDPDEARLERCWSVLGELEATIGSAALQQCKEKVGDAAAAVYAERPLLLDSLALELTESLRCMREQSAVIAEAEALLGELAAISTSGAEAQRASLSEASQESPASPALAGAIAAAKAWLSAHRASEDARAQRTAVLDALAALGYEVREGMSTAWVEQGRIVVHKPDETTYGVELTAPATRSVFQARVVTTVADNRQRDKEVEETWCAEFSKLRELVAQAGFETNIVEAKSPGTVPLKRIPTKDASDHRAMPRAQAPPRTVD
jgi:hypothetical protein